MGKTSKKNESLEVVQGRPARGSLSSYPSKMVDSIHKIRDKHPGWGAGDVLYELQKSQGYLPSDLPSIASVNRYFKQVGLIPERQPANSLPKEKTNCKVRRCHDLWELDAQGPVKVNGLGYISLINVKDAKSKAHIMAFPVPVKSKHHQPKRVYYQWCLRFAFIEWGLPKVIQVDKDSVFHPNTTKSAFPTVFHLWLIGLGIKLDFIKFPPPIKNAMVERSHQTMERQVLQGQTYQAWKELFKYCHQRRKLKNETQTNPYSKNSPPLIAFPSAKNNSRSYAIEQEQELIHLKRVYQYLAKCRWYRTISKDKTFSLGNKVYYLKQAKPYSQISIRFCNRTKKLICQDANEQIKGKIPLKKITIEQLMGYSQKQLIKMKRNIEFYRDCSIKS